MFDQITDIVIKVIMSVFLGGILGLEREKRQKVAGFKTHILVGVGSTLVVLTSLHIFDTYKDVTIIDPTRMIAGIIQGIGFLCAGTIIRGGDHVRGLTSAATLWIVSCIGIAVGAGHFLAAIIVTLVVFIVLVGTRQFEFLSSGKTISSKNDSQSEGEKSNGS